MSISISTVLGLYFKGRTNLDTRLMLVEDDLSTERNTDRKAMLWFCGVIIIIGDRICLSLCLGNIIDRISN